MKIRLFWLAFNVAILVASGPARAINCEQVRRYAQTGRSEDDIAETMVVDVAEVKKCLQKGEEAKPAPPTPAQPKAAPKTE